MSITYVEALEIIRNVAREYSETRQDTTKTVPLLDAVGRVAAKDHISPISTPPHDTSAMDGYAVSSKMISNASVEKPTRLVVKGTIGAGDHPLVLANVLEKGMVPCVEIMTGARFPENSLGPPFDACVKIEDTISIGSTASEADHKIQTCIAVGKRICPNANRRFAGGDMESGVNIVRKGEVVRSRHIMALSSVGITKITVCRRLRVAIWSTGNELSESPDQGCNVNQIFNSNGPYLCAALKELGADASYQGILKDDKFGLEEALTRARLGAWDLIITTGAVSKGKFDFMLPALEELHAQVHFHGVAIRPGHPVLFATTKHGNGNVPLFGLPGNPIATAACFRFLVLPFLRSLLGQGCEEPGVATLKFSDQHASQPGSLPSHLDCFRHGSLSSDSWGRKVVKLSSNQSPAVISQYACSGCWIHIPRGHDSRSKEAAVSCYLHLPELD